MKRTKREFDGLVRRISASVALDRKKRRKPKDKGGSETVLVEPDRPKLGSGGAEAPLEFDDRV